MVESVVDIFNTSSKYIIPLLLAGIPCYGLFKKVKVYEVFVEGAKEGFDIAIRIIPYLGCYFGWRSGCSVLLVL